jgi:hypothetical protein
VRVTLPPSQNVVELPAVITGVGGMGFAVTVIGAEGELGQPDDVNVSV